MHIVSTSLYPSNYLRRWLTLVIACGALQLSMSLLCCSQQDSASPGKKDGATSPIGAWRGESKCLVRPSDCSDEHSVYRFTAGPSPHRVNLSASKVVGRKEINMGTVECAQGPQLDGIDCALPNGNSIHFKVSDAVIEGTMSLRDGTLWRRIRLQKVEE